MTREKINLSRERDFVTNMITSDKFCQVMLPNLNIEYFDSDYTKIVCDWVAEYYRKYGESPKTNTLSVYKSRCNDIPDPSVRENVLTYLRKINDNYDSAVPNNLDYSIDQGLKFLKEKSLRAFNENLQACLDSGDIDRANELYDGYRKVVTNTDDEITFLEGDTEKAYQALTEVQEEIITLPESFEKVMGKVHRNDFLAVGGRAKSGKSWFFIWLALHAATQRKKVVYFSLEMTSSEIFNRLWAMAFGKKSGLVEKGSKFDTSKFIDPDEEGGKYRVEEYTSVVDKTYNIEVEEKRKMLKNYFHGGDIRIVSYPMNSATLGMLKDKVNDYIADGFVPDVVIIDYADIMKMSGFGGELRNQLDNTWKGIRGWAREDHILCVTGSQLGRGSFGKGHVDATQIAEDIRKLAHTTSFVALDQTPAMKKKHIMALTPFVTRASEAVDSCVFCQNLGLGQFVNGKAHLLSEVDLSDDDDGEW